MVLRYHKLLMVIGLLVIGCAGLLNARRRYSTNAPRCNTAESCQSLNSKCQCYCSGIGGFRNKTKNDRPIFIADDPNGVHCYCKQWDLDAFPRGERPADQPE